jgi:hypothetical protein
MIGGVQKKILLNNQFQIDHEFLKLLGNESEKNWKLVREDDRLTKRSADIMWIEWDENGRFKERHDEIALGRSLIMSPFSEFFTWQTTPVTDIIACTDDYIKFITRNSVYELFRITNKK